MSSSSIDIITLNKGKRTVTPDHNVFGRAYALYMYVSSRQPAPLTLVLFPLGILRRNICGMGFPTKLWYCTRIQPPYMVPPIPHCSEE
jgi:hypothetical protein